MQKRHQNTQITSIDAADKAMQIAADCCIYTNDTFTKKSLKAEAAPKEEPLALSSKEEESQ